MIKPYEKSNLYTGVYYLVSKKKWKCEIHQKGKKHHIGYFDTELEALFYYNREAYYKNKERNNFSMEEGQLYALINHKNKEIKKLKQKLANVRKAIDNQEIKK